MTERHGDEIEQHSEGCWRIITLQARGSLGIERRDDRRIEQQKMIARYMVRNGGDVVGIGDTRMGGEANAMADYANYEMRLFQQELHDWECSLPGVQPRLKPRQVQYGWSAAGSHRNTNGIWRGGVALAAGDEALRRQQCSIDDCRDWGRYIGRVYKGSEKRKLAVVQVYTPDTTCDVNNDDRGDYSQELGRKAASIKGGVTNNKWSIGKELKKPSDDMIEHPKRLLFSDLRLHLAHYALDPN